MELSYGAINLLRVVVTTDGTRQMNSEGKEELSPLRLNGEESAQRRFFMKESQKIIDEVQPPIQKMVTDYNAMLEAKKDVYKKDFPIAESEAQKDYDVRMAIALSQDEELVNAVTAVKAEDVIIRETKHSIDITQKTQDFLKKYFILFGDVSGYVMADDSLVEELNTMFVV